MLADNIEFVYQKYYRLNNINRFFIIMTRQMFGKMKLDGEDTSGDDMERFEKSALVTASSRISDVAVRSLMCNELAYLEEASAYNPRSSEHKEVIEWLCTDIIRPLAFDPVLLHMWNTFNIAPLSSRAWTQSVVMDEHLREGSFLVRFNTKDDKFSGLVITWQTSLQWSARGCLRIHIKGSTREEPTWSAWSERREGETRRRCTVHHREQTILVDSLGV